MSDVVIRAEGLGKKYTIGHETQRERYPALRDVIARGARDFLRKARDMIHGRSIIEGDQLEEVWALRDVSFEVQRGEVVGIIGRNGAGKSTLLKILSRITEPSNGRVSINGRVASLLEVGTGFHPELTGRENIFLNGAILGMSRSEIRDKFDQIVAFAEVEKFLDTPVKRYSSGMYVRLAFAVAAHLEPEILIVDEVLAVGDAQFQKKCLGKMENVAQEGRTVLFVSHNMAAVNQLCEKVILLENGYVKEFDQPSKVVGHYLNSGRLDTASMDLIRYPFRQGSKKAKFEWAQIRNSKGHICQDFSVGDDIEIALSLRLTDDDRNIKVAVQMQTSDGIPLSNMIDSDSGFKITEPRELEELSVTIKDVRLYPGTYFLSFWAGSTNSVETYDHVEDCVSFNIVDGGKLTTRSLPRSAGILFLTPTWKRAADVTSHAMHGVSKLT